MTTSGFSSGFFKTPLSGVSFWNRTDLVGLGNILKPYVSRQKQQQTSKWTTYSKVSSSVMGDTIYDAERFLLLQINVSLGAMRYNQVNHTEDVREETGVFGTAEWLTGYRVNKWNDSYNNREIPSTGRGRSPFIIIHRHNTNHSEMVSTKSKVWIVYLFTLLALLMLMASSPLDDLQQSI